MSSEFWMTIWAGLVVLLFAVCLLSVFVGAEGILGVIGFTLIALILIIGLSWQLFG